MKNPFLLAFLFSTFFLFFSCKKNNPPENLSILKGENYYPLEIGKYIVYELDSIVWFEQSGSDCNLVTDTSHSYLKEKIVGTYQDSEEQTNYVLERFIRFDLNEDWQIADVWNITQGESRIERTEENYKFIKMIFPVSAGSRWNGNAFIDKEVIQSFKGNSIKVYKNWGDDYTYLSVDETDQIGNLNLDSVATIVQADSGDNDLFSHRYSVEKYARNIGLVYKEQLIIDHNCCGFHPDTLAPCHDLLWEDKAERGFKLIQKVIEYN